MTARPLITVGVICYNSQSIVKSLIDSIKLQTWENLEVVIVDDCSTDMTWQTLQETVENGAKNIPTRIFRNDQNGGAGVSRKRIVEEARGEYIAFFDDDDISLPERIEKQYDRIVSYRKQLDESLPVICHISRTVRTANHAEFYIEAMGCCDGIAPHGDDVLRCILMGNKKAVRSYGSIGTGLLMASRQDFIDAGNFDSAFRRAQDVELDIRWAKMGAHFVGVAEPLMIQNMTVTKRKIDLEEKYVLMFLEKHRDYLDKKHAYDFITHWIRAKYAYLSGNKGRFVENLLLAFFANPAHFFQRGLSAKAGTKFNAIIKRKYESSSKT